MARSSKAGGKRSAAKTRKARSVKRRNHAKTKRPVRPATRSKPPNTSNAELKEAREQQAATAEILKVIAKSPDSEQPVFEAIAASAKQLMRGHTAGVFRFIEGVVYLKAFTSTTPEADDVLKNEFPMPISNFPLAQQNVLSGETEQIPDSEAGKEYQVRIARARGYRSIMFSPLMHHGAAIGMIAISRREPGLFADHHVQLLRTFADQAVIAIENARLFNETQEALEQQRASSDILRVISRSVADPQPVFDKILDSCKHLFGSDETAVLLLDGEATITLGAYVGRQQSAVAGTFPAPLEKSPAGRAIRERRVAHYTDVANDPQLTRAVRRVAQLAGYVSMAYAPMLSNGRGIGAIGVSRIKGSFSDKELTLLQTFADQAVIAIENARLFNEVQAKTRDLSEALTYQTGSANILKVIASSPTDVEPALRAIVESSCELCDAYDATVVLQDGENLRFSAHHGPIPIGLDKWPISRGWTAGRAFLDQQPVQISDALSLGDDEFPEAQELARRQGHRTILSVPLLREGDSLGAITLRRLEVNPFTEKQISLLQTFADQAVIAIENVRLFDEVQSKTHDLTESLQQQTATADVLKVISRSTFDLPAVLQTLVESAARLCDADKTIITRERNGAFYRAESHGFSQAFRDFVEQTPIEVERGSTFGRALLEGQVVHVPDVLNDFEYTYLEGQRLGEYRTVLTVPMLRQSVPIGVLSLTRSQVRPFSGKQIELATTFADQAAIAIENVRLFNETTEALERQTATADILKVIASSPDDVQPVFDAIALSSNRIVEGFSTTVLSIIGETVHLSAFTPTNPEADAALKSFFPRPLSSVSWGEAVIRGDIFQIADTETDIPEQSPRRKMARLRGWRSALWVPLLREGKAIGAIGVTRAEPGTFADHHLQLLQTFADQAVIAIENVRLFNETQDSLARQTAMAQVLEVINASPGDLKPVFDTILEKATELCGASFGFLNINLGKDMHQNVATLGAPLKFVDMFRDPMYLGPETATGRLVRGESYVHTLDGADDDAYRLNPVRRALVDIGGARTHLAVPIRRDDVMLGSFTIYRREVRPFSPEMIALVQSFAAQAAIAIDNARLFNETQEALERQTATADILEVIASSPSDVQPVFDAIAERSNKLVGGLSSAVYRVVDNVAHLMAFTPVSPAADAVLQAAFPCQISHLNWGEAILAGDAYQVADAQVEFVTQPSWLQLAQERGWRSSLAVPLMRSGLAIGVITVTRVEAGRFNDHFVQLLKTFADQAVIAIENARLFNETKEALARQTATSDVLKVIAGSPGDLSPVFDKMLENATRVCGAEFGSMNLLEGDMLRQVALYNAPSAFAAARMNKAFRVHPRTSLADAIHGKQVVQVDDMRKHRAYIERNPSSVELTELAGARTIVVVPMLRQDEAIGVITVYRQEVRAFNDKQIELLTNFASQAVIAIENTRLLRELRERTDALSRSLDDLRAAQDRLVQTEKLASLGQLTAGIAHEIKNPLNFVNNFSALSAELTDELNDLLKEAALTDKMQEEVGELTKLLRENLQKVVQHGQRADSIVKNMLLHSREGSGEQRNADINSLVDESLNLAYHGARAEKAGFNITLKRDFDAGAGSAELFPQEITRALLNLISNGFYAARKRMTENGEASFEPMLLAATRDLGTSVEIRIRDNGTGIPLAIKEKIFNPFFTTKPAGEGTGLGLSMSHDIIVKQHGGTIRVETEPGAFTEFIVTLPRTTSAQPNRSNQ